MLSPKNSFISGFFLKLPLSPVDFRKKKHYISEL